jgi:hypothetical protein
MLEFIDQLRKCDRDWLHYLTPPLRKEPSLTLRQFHRCKALLVVVRHAIDPRAHGASAGHRKASADRTPHRYWSCLIEPQVVGIRIENHWHSPMDG